MPLSIGETAPDFEAETTEGHIHFHAWLGQAWCIMFSHPKDFTPVCTTELGSVATLKPEFDARGVKVIGISVDSVENHAKWSHDIETISGSAVNYPMIGDTNLAVAKLYGMLPASAAGTSASRTPADNATVRTVYVIGPDKVIKAQISYPMSTGRNFHEVLRLIDSLQLTARSKVATPVNWEPGGDVIILPAVQEAEARERFPDGWKSPLPYLRIVPQPKA
jgi:alkyl hydroperoxide reductase subunit AhpC